MLHVLNGDATRLKLERAGIPGSLTVWADVLHDGPTPIGMTAAEFRKVRARYLGPNLVKSESSILALSSDWDAGLDRYREHEEVIFWLEHDLFDQLILIRHLHWLTTIHRGPTRFSLICIGSFPGVENFTGLGALTPEQLVTLLPERRPLTEGQIATGCRAWELFCAPDPRPLSLLGGADTAALPFLHGALRRHFDDYPSTRNGLSRSQQQMLGAIEAGNETFQAIFAAAARMEERVFMGDATFWSILKGLADARVPLVDIDAPDRPAIAGRVVMAGEVPITDTAVRLTGAGRRMLAGSGDHVRLNGISRWAGGVHLSTDRYYRWDGEMLSDAQGLDTP